MVMAASAAFFMAPLLGSCWLMTPRLRSEVPALPVAGAVLEGLIVASSVAAACAGGLARRTTPVMVCLSMSRHFRDRALS